MALFKDIEDFCTVFPALESASWDQFKIFCELVEHKTFRNEILGPTLYSALHTAYQASIAPTPTPMTGALAALLPEVRRAVAFHAVHEAARTLVATIDGAGVTNAETERRKPATMWRTTMTLGSILSQAHDFTDLCIGHLLANDTTLTQWADSPIRTALRESFIRDMRHVTPYINISGPWLLHKLRPAMRTVQTGPIRKIIGDTHYTSILTKLNAGTPLSATEAAILEEARPAMLNLAIAEQMVPLSMHLDHQGAWTWEMATSGSGISAGAKSASNDKLNANVRSYQAKGDMHLAQLNQLINPQENSEFRSGASDGMYSLI